MYLASRRPVSESKSAALSGIFNLARLLKLESRLGAAETSLAGRLSVAGRLSGTVEFSGIVRLGIAV